MKPITLKRRLLNTMGFTKTPRERSSSEDSSTKPVEAEPVEGVVVSDFSEAVVGDEPPPLTLLRRNSGRISLAPWLRDELAWPSRHGCATSSAPVDHGGELELLATRPWSLGLADTTEQSCCFTHPPLVHLKRHEYLEGNSS